MNSITRKEGITDARELGMPKYIILGVQHLFAMFGATILVPVLTWLSVSSTLLFAGIGTLVFHFVSKLQVPAFLGSSFAFLGGGMSMILYGMISAVGVRNLIEGSVDFNSSRNVFVAASILVIAIGLKYGAEDNVSMGPIHFSGLALAVIVGVTMNAILPDKLGIKVKSVHGKEKR